MVIPPFELVRFPAVVFGEGSLSRVPEVAARFGRRALLVTGARSLSDSPHWPVLERDLAARGVAIEILRVEGEPSPDLVDDAVEMHRDAGIEVVVGIGGGSALDAAKAVAGLLPHGNSVKDHLEGVGQGIPYRGPALPFIAAPTTAGTGTEATKNAVLSSRGAGGFKKSFRHEALVARCAVIDPLLLASCPPQLVAADGMDALTQLIESYVSTRANPFTGALVESGLAAARDGLLPWYEGTGDARAARSSMAYAALISGIALAQAGLGSVHGLASPMGAFFPIPHGVVCGTLVAPATEVNVAALRSRDPDGPALAGYARIAAILAGRDDVTPSDGPELLVRLLEEWTHRLQLPRLSEYGVGEVDLDRIVAAGRGSSMKTNPIVLTDEEMRRLLRARL